MIIGIAIKANETNKTKLISRNVYRVLLFIKLKSLNFKANKGNSATMSKLSKRMSSASVVEEINTD